MAHAGTMDLGRNVQAKPSGNPWTSAALVVAVALAIVAGTLFALNAGLVGKAAKPADRSYDAIEAQRGAMPLVTDRNYDAIEAHRVAIGVAAPVCRSVSPTSGFAFNVSCSAQAAAVTIVQPALEAKAAQLAAMQKLQGDISRYPFIVVPRVTVPSSPSGTFHAGNPAIADPINLLPGWKSVYIPPIRDRVGGP